MQLLQKPLQRLLPNRHTQLPLYYVLLLLQQLRAHHNRYGFCTLCTITANSSATLPVSAMLLKLLVMNH